MLSNHISREKTGHETIHSKKGPLRDHEKKPFPLYNNKIKLIVSSITIDNYYPHPHQRSTTHDLPTRRTTISQTESRKVFWTALNYAFVSHVCHRSMC